ncbi:hypothetical protein BS78_02G044000 [Paspalum vaginatum]|nr:hypothetical protein BS78_02G044000 [Paspalum vaginatum]
MAANQRKQAVRSTCTLRRELHQRNTNGCCSNTKLLRTAGTNIKANRLYGVNGELAHTPLKKVKNSTDPSPQNRLTGIITFYILKFFLCLHAPSRLV